MINDSLNSVNGLLSTIIRNRQADDIRKLRELQEKNLSGNYNEAALLEIIADLPKEDRDKILDAIKKKNKTKTSSGKTVTITNKEQKPSTLKEIDSTLASVPEKTYAVIAVVMLVIFVILIIIIASVYSIR